MSTATAKPLTGRHVLFLLLGFFASIVAINVVFVWLALTSFSGVETENAYQKGLRYNDVLQSAENQKRLGWDVQFGHDRASGLVTAAFLDNFERPISGLEVTVEAIRPTHLGFDREFALHEVAPGRYQAEADLPLAGRWLLRLSARQKASVLYYLEKEIWLK